MVEPDVLSVYLELQNCTDIFLRENIFRKKKKSCKVLERFPSNDFFQGFKIAEQSVHSSRTSVSGDNRGRGVPVVMTTAERKGGDFRVKEGSVVPFEFERPPARQAITVSFEFAQSRQAITAPHHMWPQGACSCTWLWY